MLRSRFPIGRVSALAAIAVFAFLLTQRSPGTHWRTLEPGIEFATLRGEPWCRSGSAALAVLRLDPARARIQVRTFSRESEGRPLDILRWLERTHALAVFNAGQYYADYSYMGLLVSRGEVISSRSHPTFQAALVSEPRAAGPAARVLDLAREPLDLDSLAWREVAQSFMLFDRDGLLRVRRSELIAARTAVAEDRRDRLVVITSEGGYTLRDFARMLEELPLDLRQAMAMDGGLEAEMVVRAGRFRYASFGAWSADPKAGNRPDPPVALPTVITVSPR
ncbi:MAG TPA: phosphodiester glycosidase family protein [Terriglobales bacterium]|nr:phosphodiester glycosidase family protein [Terriglobales bacterium]